MLNLMTAPDKEVSPEIDADVVQYSPVASATIALAPTCPEASVLAAPPPIGATMTLPAESVQ